LPVSAARFVQRGKTGTLDDNGTVLRMQFHTFDEMAAVLAENVPHALVQDWWSRLEATIRDICARHGANRRENISNLIDKHLSQHPAVSPELVRELREMRVLRNRCAHGEAPPLTADEARAFAHRAWTIGWDLATKDEKVVV
jgi:hypothetical protein